MESDHFDALARTLTSVRSRRQALVAILGGALGMVLGATSIEETEAKKKKPCPACMKRKKGKCKGKKPDGTACPGGTCQGGSCCVPQETGLICAAGCGTRSDTCGGTVSCPCPAGQDCLGNGSCARTCNSATQNCPMGCRCSGARSAEGAVICTPQSVVTCDQVPQPCTTSTECPQGSVCQFTPCGAGGTTAFRCMPVCNG